MGVDHITKPIYLSISADNKKEYKKLLLNAAKENGIDEEGDDLSFVIDLDNHTFQTEEYYFDEQDTSIHFNGMMQANNGSGETYVSFAIPLSDIVLIDILQAGIKKFNKLKSALENLS